MSAAQPISPSNDNTAPDYRRQATEYAELARTTRSLKESSRYRKMAEACAALAREEDGLTGAGEPAGSDAKP